MFAVSEQVIIELYHEGEIIVGFLR
ncbi:hypothetical protein [Anaeromicropila herbilytica]